jgi:hypothetical protein
MASRIVLRDLSDLAPYLEGDAPLPIGRQPVPLRVAEMRPAILKEPSTRAELIKRVAQLRRHGYAVRVDEYIETAGEYGGSVEDEELFNDFQAINWS